GKAQQRKLLARGREQKIALIAREIRCAMKLWPVAADRAAHVMAGRERIAAEIAGQREEIAELDTLVAADAWDRRFAARIARREIVDDRALEALLVVEHVMRDRQALGDALRVMDVLAGAAGALLLHRGAVVVKLQRDADDVVTLARQ